MRRIPPSTCKEFRLGAGAAAAALAAILWLGSAAPAGAATAPEAPVMGPMTGAVTLRSARIWAGVAAKNWSGPPRSAWIEYHAAPAAGTSAEPWQRTAAQALDGGHHGATWLLSGLEPGTRYQYRLRWSTGPGAAQVSDTQEFSTDPLWQYRSDPPGLRILAGSCAYTNDAAADRPGKPYGQSPAIFEAMARRKPDLTLWMGDNIYFREPDFEDEAAMAGRYDQWRALPEMQGLLHAGRHIATWDDHDYGLNDSNMSNTSKDASLRLFQGYWANPSYGLPGLPGVFTHYVTSDVEVFLLDDRWYRDSDQLVDADREMFGAAQLRWLKNALVASTATFRLVVSGTQVLNLHNHFEGWNRFERESTSFLSWLEHQKVPGVIFLSGDRHFAALLRADRPGNYPLYELTCSPLTSTPYADPSDDVRDNSRLVPGSLVTRNNFCELEVSGPRGHRKLGVSIRGADGQALFEREFAEADLR